jgi:hypothetical protein
VSDTLGADFIYTTLSGDSGVAAITTDIYTARIVPETVTNTETINFYMSGQYNPSLEYFSAEWSIDCRAKEYYDSLQLAVAVRDAINRVTSAVGGYTYHGVNQIGGTIPPADEADVYNTPVTITVRRK